MKKLLLIPLLSLLVLCACKNDDITPRNEAEALALDKISKNQNILAESYKGLATIIKKDDIINTKKESDTRTDFINKMSAKYEGLFKKVVHRRADQETHNVFIKIPDIPGESRATRYGRVLTQEHPIDELAKLIANVAKIQEKNENQKEWIVLKSYASNGTKMPIPKEFAALNYEQILKSITISEILADPTTTEAQMEYTLKDVLISSYFPPIMKGLLLPAVQKYTESTTTNDPFMKWLNTEVNPAVGGALDRDLIRRISAASYLGGLDLIVNDYYYNENQDGASLQVLEARFETALIFLWGEIWPIAN
ncbi:MAG: hypothetical protein ACFCUU_17120 [Cyclobacteriaceae bacterium]